MLVIKMVCIFTLVRIVNEGVKLSIDDRSFEDYVKGWFCAVGKKTAKKKRLSFCINRSMLRQVNIVSSILLVL